MNDYNNNRAIAPSNPQAAALAINDPALRDFAQKLKLLLPGGSKLSDVEALAGAEYAKTSGLDPFTGEFYIAPGTGVVLGYRGALKMQSQQGIAPDYRYRALTDDERDWHDVLTGDKATICYATEPNEAAQARKRGDAPQVWQGVGIVRKHEMWKSEEWRKTPDGSKNYKFRLPEAEWKERVDPPKGRSWGWVAQNRAMRDCMKHMGLPVPPDADTIIKQAQAAGIKVSVPAGALLSDEQAAALVAETITAHVRDIAPPPAEQLQAQAARNITTMRGPATDDPFGIDEPEPPTTEDAPNDPGVPGVAQLEQQAAQIKARILGLAQNGGDWKHTPCNENKRNAANRGFAILIPNEDRRHAIRQYILGHDSSSYTEGEVATLLGWFDIQKGPDGYVPGAQVLAEIKVLAAALGLDKADEVSA